MSEQSLISPLLDGFVLGNSMSSHDGVRCCPALKENSEDKYIVKIISVPASQVQLDALLLTGACKTPEDAMDYFKDMAENIVKEAEFLNTLSSLEGFLPYEGWQIVPMEDGRIGYEVWLLSRYKRSLQRLLRKRPLTHLETVNLGLDLCTALAVCRRAGYLYVDLKPGNIFLSEKRDFRIGDLGFVKLDSLEYTSLADKYRSPYAPAEIRDDMKTINTTADTYAVGMILYQIYNDGDLPDPNHDPAKPYPCPPNANYEISEIIMKALEPDVDKRWKDPMEMGQALVAYMQRNSVNNTPITAPTGVLPVKEVQQILAEQQAAAEEAAEKAAEAVVADTLQTEPAAEAETVSPAESVTEDAAEPVFEEEPPETDHAEEEPDLDIFKDEAEDDEDLDFSIAFLDEPAREIFREKEIPETESPLQQKQRMRQEKRAKSAKIVPVIAILLVLALLACGGFWFYQTQYLKTIDDLTVEGSQNMLTVTVDTDMDTSHLLISCTDTYGNSLVQPVSDNQAVFTGLLPDSLYRIEVTSTGFHELHGKTAEIFTTDAVTNVVSMSAVTGPDDGSVLLNMTVDGSDPDEWTITCSAEGQQDIVQTFTGHTVTIRDLTVGCRYTLTLTASDGSQLVGQTQLEFEATRLIMAENLSIVSCIDGNMTVSWDAPEDVAVERWGVRCYNDEGHEEVLEIAGTEIVFTGIDSTKSYTVEVTASGMTEPSRVGITANPITVTGLTVDESDPGRLTVNWTHDGETPEGGWLFLYSFAGYEDQQNVVKCTEASANFEPRIPGAAYHFVIQAADSTSVFNSTHTYTTANADLFNDHDLDVKKVTAYLLPTPEEEEWTAETVDKDVYTDTFKAGDKISMVLKSADPFELPNTTFQVMYVIRDEEGHVLSQYTALETLNWKDLWYPDTYRNCELDIPKVPSAAGTYSVSVYFGFDAVTSTTFTITE